MSAAATGRSVVVVGAGPAGMMAAIAAANAGAAVQLLEGNTRAGRKLMLTGKGRCNVTNNCADLQLLIRQVPTNGRFLYSAFSAFMPRDTIEFFQNAGVPLKTERGQRVFPQSDKSLDIVDAMVEQVRKAGVAFCPEEKAQSLVLHEGKLTGIQTNRRTITADAVVVATGGLSYPKTGSTGDGYTLAKQAGHSITVPKPSLVPLEAHDGFCSQLQGLSLRNVAITVQDTRTGRCVYDDFGELLFTHFGLSGPVILSASAHMRQMQALRYRVDINLKPAMAPHRLDARLQREIAESPNRQFINLMNALLPKKLVPVFVKRTGIPMQTVANQITREQRAKIAQLLSCFSVTIQRFRPIEEAIITAGGVQVKEIDPKTMQSKKLPGVYFAGEVLDVDAYTGGYNLQIAFATGKLAGISAAAIR